MTEAEKRDLGTEGGGRGTTKGPKNLEGEGYAHHLDYGSGFPKAHTPQNFSNDAVKIDEVCYTSMMAI